MQISYHILLLFLFTCLGAYINRDKFSTVERSITAGIYLPSYAVALIFSFLFGLLIWIVVEIVLWKVALPL